VIALLLAVAFATPPIPPLELRVETVDVPATVDVPIDTLYWVNLDHPKGAAEAVAEILGDDLSDCANLIGPHGFQPSRADALWARDLLRYAVVEVTAEAIYVAGQPVVRLERGRVPDGAKDGVVIRPLLKRLLAQHEAQIQFAAACGHPEWRPGGPPTSASSARLLAVAPDMPFDVVHEVLLTARKARFRSFYLYAKGRRTMSDPLAAPPDLVDAGLRVFVASDGGLGLDSEEESRDNATALTGYLPAPRRSRSARVVPYPASPFSAVVAASGALLAKGWEPAVLPRLDAEDLRAARLPAAATAATTRIPAKRAVSAVPVTLPEGGALETAADARRTRFSISGATAHLAIFTPPAHVADALNTPEMGAQLKKVLTCYRDEEHDKPGLKGDLVLEMRVRPNGEAERGVYLPTSTITDDLLRSCVLDQFLALRLPAAALTPEPMLWRVRFVPNAQLADEAPEERR
jgi:hypothetical protein